MSYSSKQKNHIILEAPGPSYWYSPKVVNAEELREVEPWADFEAISVPIHKVFGHDFYTLCSYLSSLSKKKKRKSLFQYSYSKLRIFYHNRAKL